LVWIVNLRPRILDRYIGGQVLGATAFGVAVLCLVLVFGNIFKEMLPRLVEQQVSPGYFLLFMLYVLPYSLVFTIPWGFLTAVLLVFGRLSADSELVSMRMAGISMQRIAAPVLLMAGAFSLFCLYINVEVAPRAKTAIEDMFYDMATRYPEAVLQPDTVIDAFPGRVIYFRSKDEDGLMRDMVILETDGNSRVSRVVTAAEGRMLPDLDNLEIRFQMRDLYITAVASDDSREKISRILAGESELPPYDLSELKDRRIKASALTNREIHAALAAKGGEKPVRGQRNTFRAEISKRFSFSLACVTFGLIGIPLGITAQRRETAAGFVLSLIVASLYFLFIILGDTLSAKSGWLPHVLMWLPNLVFLGIGWHLFRRLNKR